MFQQRKQNLNNSLMGLRGLASLFIIVSNAGNMDQLSGPHSLLAAGQMTIYFFFVLSGYLLTKKSLDEIQPSKDDQPRRILNLNIVNFAVRRFFRIYPAFLAALVLYKLLNYIQDFKHPFWDFNVDILKWALLGDVFNHFWTIKVDMVFNFIIMPIIMIVSSEIMIIEYKFLKNPRFKILWGIFLLATVKIVMFQVGLGQMSYPFFQKLQNNLSIYWWGCIAGALCHYVKQTSINFSLNSKKAKLLIDAVIYLGLASIVLRNRGIAGDLFDVRNDPWWQSLNYLAPFYAGLIFFIDLFGASCSFGRLMALQPFVFLGQISYSVYLIHVFALLLICGQTPLVGLIGIFASVLLSALLGFILHKLVEEPGLRVGDYLIHGIISLQEKFKYVPLDKELGTSATA